MLNKSILGQVSLVQKDGRVVVRLDTAGLSRRRQQGQVNSEP